jgi:deazaflavin-dependent oxidoreductase (nitroreductase family)
MSRVDTFERWMYRGGRPNRVAAVLNRAWAVIGRAGLWPNRLAALEVRGRRTGRLLSVPVVLAEYRGERYLVSMLGERASWVSNVREAHGHAVLRHGRAEAIHLEEVKADERAPVLKRYLEVAPGARAHIPVDRRAPLEDFALIAGQYPVFRIRAA